VVDVTPVTHAAGGAVKLGNSVVDPGFMEGLSASVWRWSRDNGSWRADKVITIPAEPAEADALPPALKPFGAVPPLVTDINLSVDNKFLYVSCWGIGELKQYDVSDPASVLGLLLLPAVIMVGRVGDAPANLQPCQSTSRDSQPCSATWASRAR
jgi:hypothetical protein